MSDLGDFESTDVELPIENPRVTYKMHRVTVSNRPVVMMGTINIRAMIRILAKARLESIAIEGGECESPQSPYPQYASPRPSKNKKMKSKSSKKKRSKTPKVPTPSLSPMPNLLAADTPTKAVAPSPSPTKSPSPVPSARDIQSEVHAPSSSPILSMDKATSPASSPTPASVESSDATPPPAQSKSAPSSETNSPVLSPTPDQTPEKNLEDDPFCFRIEPDAIVVGKDAVAFVAFTNPLNIDITQINVNAEPAKFITPNWRKQSVEQIKLKETFTWKIHFKPSNPGPLLFEFELESKEDKFSSSKMLQVVPAFLFTVSTEEEEVEFGNDIKLNLKFTEINKFAKLNAHVIPKYENKDGEIIPLEEIIEYKLKFQKDENEFIKSLTMESDRYAQVELNNIKQFFFDVYVIKLDWKNKEYGIRYETSCHVCFKAEQNFPPPPAEANE